jgi:hypothetical protein
MDYDTINKYYSLFKKHFFNKELKNAHQFYADLADLIDQLKLNISSLEKNEISNFEKDVTSTFNKDILM